MDKLSLFDQVSNAEYLFFSWEQFSKRKRNKLDVMRFEYELERNIFDLHRDITDQTYTHGPYFEFVIRDPKVRNVCKATVRDRIVHHAVFEGLMKLFEPSFIPYSFSCRVGKGTHKGVVALERMIRKETDNYRKPCYVLKCDVKKFFDTIDHRILLSVLKDKIKDPDTLWLLDRIISSYQSASSNLFSPKGVPIGNLTSQVFANIYMGVFDNFVKHKLKVKYYARYTDDFVFISTDENYLQSLINPIENFLEKKLELKLHPNKVTIRKNTQGVDFLGYVLLPHCQLIRKRTKNRMMRMLRGKIQSYRRGLVTEESINQSLQSYLGMLSHADAYKLSEILKNQLIM